MDYIQSNYENIQNIIKHHLKADSYSKPIDSIFLNERYFNKIDYKPYFQRNYVWARDKASYFIESIFLGTEIPPLVLFDNGEKIEIIDGRQRFETVKKFLDNELSLSPSAVNTLPILENKKFNDLDDDLKNEFTEVKLRVLIFSVLNEPKLSELDEDMIKKEIFRRYNSGITSLKKEENQRAKFINDEFTTLLKNELEKNYRFYNTLQKLYLSKRDLSKDKRDCINILTGRIRSIISLFKIPITQYAKLSSKQENIDSYYTYHITKNLPTKDDKEQLIEQIYEIAKVIENINANFEDIILQDGKCNIDDDSTELYKHLLNNRLLNECLFWALKILKDSNYDHFKAFDNQLINKISKYILSNSSIFEITGSHFYKRIIERYEYIAQFFIQNYNISKYSFMLNGKIELPEKSYETSSWKDKIIKKIPVAMSIDDICMRVDKNRFMIRPPYQRGETISISKASSLLESMMLGIKVPPIFIYKRKDGVSEVIDGQQRLLSVLGYLNRTYTDDKGNTSYSKNASYKLKGLKILKDINGNNHTELSNQYNALYEKLLDFQIDIIEIDSASNPNFDQIDLFLRLNTKPYEIKENSFEMWNSYSSKKLIDKIKGLYKNEAYSWFFKNDHRNRMKNEELITSLAYLYYQSVHGGKDSKSALDIYIRNNRVNARIKKKANITKLLEHCNFSSTTRDNFIVSIDQVEVFINKIALILNSNQKKEKFNDLLAHEKSNSRTDQGYYILWLLLSQFDEKQILSHQDDFFNRTNLLFRYIKYGEYDKDITSDDFLKILQKEISLLENL